MATTTLADMEDGQEGNDVFGHYSATSMDRWVLLNPLAGQVIECTLPGDFALESGVKAAFIVCGRILEEDGGMGIEVRSLGCTSGKLSTRLGSIFNRRPNHIHICTGIGICQSERGYAFHLDELTLRDAAHFKADYLTASGIRRLQTKSTRLDAEAEEPGAKDTPGKDTALPRKRMTPKAKDGAKPGEKGDKKDTKRKEEKTPKTRKATPKKDEKGREGKDPGKPREDDDLEAYAKLRAQLDQLQEAARRRKAEKEEVERITDGILSPSVTSSVQVPALSNGGRLPDFLNLRSLGDVQRSQKEKKTRDPEGRRDNTTKLSKELIPTSNMDGKLALNAALVLQHQQGDRNGKEDKERKKKAKKDKKKKKKKGEKKEKSKKKKKKKDDGSPGSSGGSSGSSKRTRRSSSSSSSSDTESLDLLPPLKRKSEGKPGAVFQLLLDKVEEHLAAVGEFQARGGTGLSGTKILTYYNALIKGGVNPTSRDGRELYLIAVSLDLLRSGLLAKMADGLAARFFALHQAALDGGWSSARNLEIHTPELLSAAGTQVTLEARKHTKLLEKMKGYPDNRQESWNRGNWQNNWTPPSKGWGDTKGKGKRGNQKGRDDPWQKGKGKNQYPKQQAQQWEASAPKTDKAEKDK